MAVMMVIVGLSLILPSLGRSVGRSHVDPDEEQPASTKNKTTNPKSPARDRKLERGKAEESE